VSSNLRTLPEYDFCSDQVVAETASNLELFIYENEPAGAEDAKEFRDGLLAVLSEARGDWEAQPCQCVKCTTPETTTERNFRGIGELERTGYIPPGSAAERELSGSEAASFDKALANSPRRIETPAEPSAFVDRVLSAARREISGKRFTTGSPLHLLEMFIKIVEDRQRPSPADLVGALQDKVHADEPGRAASSVKTSAPTPDDTHDLGAGDSP
jgi:hypothetical protein